VNGGSLPSYERDAASPRLPAPEGPPASAIALALDGDGTRERTVARGAYRVVEADRERLGRSPVRAQVWLVAVDRATRLAWLARVGGASIVFAGEEPERGPIEGWFNVRLADCCRLPPDLHGPIDVTAALGPFLSSAVEARFRS
jgi:hypothetical protein